jgi:hypothetical protein
VPLPPWQSTHDTATEGDACMVAASVFVWQVKHPRLSFDCSGDAPEDAGG